jgi:hypothetical protein
VKNEDLTPLGFERRESVSKITKCDLKAMKVFQVLAFCLHGARVKSRFDDPISFYPIACQEKGAYHV